MAIQYTDIGHSAPNDWLWIFFDDEISTIQAGLSRTHELVWGGDVKIEDTWRGRFEAKTGYCSIVPPSSRLPRRLPPDWILSALKRKFDFQIVRFYYFQDGVEEITPNPRRKRN